MLNHNEEELIQSGSAIGQIASGRVCASGFNELGQGEGNLY